MNDFITGTIVHLYADYGPLTLLLASLIFFAAVTGSIASLERRSYRYTREKKESFHRNFSTLLDFLILNPALILVAAYTTERMYKLPSLLAGKTTLSNSEFAALNDVLATLLNTKLLLPIVLGAAVTAWFLYIRSLEKSKNLGGFWRSQSITTHYMGAATILMLYVIITFTYRTFCFLWYVVNVTRGGLKPDPIEWAVALETIGRILIGVNLFFVLFSLVVIGFVVHDLFLDPTRTTNRSLRVLVAPPFVVVVALGFIFGPMFSIHNNLLEAKIDHVERLISERRGLVGAERERLTERIREVRALREWPLTKRQTFLPAFGQILALIASALLTIGGDRFIKFLLPPPSTPPGPTGSE